MSKKIAVFLKWFLPTVIVIAIVAEIGIPIIKMNSYFRQQPFNLNNYNLFDVGVVDVNNDNKLDVFTTNHSSRQSLLVNEDSRQFNNVLSQLKLDQNLDFPGIENLLDKPNIERSGLYIYIQNKNLNIVNKNIGLDSVSGLIEVSWPITINQKKFTQVDLKQNQLSSGATQTALNFSLQRNSFLSIDNFSSVPFSFRISDNMPLKQIYVGINRVNPSSHSFTLSLRDRHSMAWADINNDNQIDLFIGRGGASGKMKQLPERFNDELLINENTIFKNNADELGIVKNSCPGRQSAWVDFDQDGQLDLYNVCGRYQPFSNQVYQQQENGSFVDVATKVGLNLSGKEPFVWLDYDNDGDMDLLTQEKDRFQLYVNQLGKFKPQSISQKLKSELLKLTISDYDLDGDLDVYAVLKDSNLLLINDNSRYLPTNPASVGLPVKGLTANWVDYDNDGLPDLHVFPGGLYRQFPNHQFKATQILFNNKYSLSALIEARSTWFDVNNDGSRDLLVALYELPLWVRISNRLHLISDFLLKKKLSVNHKNWQSKLYLNKNSRHHWLQVKLVGADGNRQAIGAKVKLKMPTSTQLQQVAQSEGSHYSQGHYRLYFGLGNYDKINSLEVIWPNGQIQEIKKPEIDQLLIIKQNTRSKKST